MSWRIKGIALVRDNVRISMDSIRSSRIRATLTILIIALGIMALVGILTAIDSIKKSITDQFTLMGANTFTIESRSMHVQVGARRYRKKNHARISYREALQFKEDFNFPALTSITTTATGLGTIKYKSEKTNPNIHVVGADENYIYTSGFEIERGRNFSEQDILSNRHVTMLGKDVANVLFGEFRDPVGEVVSVGGGKFRVIGVLKSKGSSFAGLDRTCILPITNVRHYYSRPNMRHDINVMPLDQKLLDMAASEAEALFRIVRGLWSKQDWSARHITAICRCFKIVYEGRYCTGCRY